MCVCVCMCVYVCLYAGMHKNIITYLYLNWLFLLIKIITSG